MTSPYVYTVPKALVDKTSEYWVRKILTNFTVTVKGKDGIKHVQDWFELQKATLRDSCNPSDLKAIETQAARWRELFGGAYSKDANGRTICRWEDFFQHVYNKFIVEMGRDKFKEKLRPTMDAFFASIDLNSDGFLSRGEMSKYFLGNGLVQEEIDAMFSVIDLNHDEKISMEEYLEAWTAFFCDTSSSSSSRATIAGPLVDLPIKIVE